MHPRSSGEQAVDYGDRAHSAHSSPLVGYGSIDGQDPLAKSGIDLDQPSFERAGFARITPPRLFDAFADLSQYKDAQIEINIFDRAIPSPYIRIAARRLADLGNNIGVD